MPGPKTLKRTLKLKVSPKLTKAQMKFAKKSWSGNDNGKDNKVYLYIDIRTNIVVYVGQTYASFRARNNNHRSTKSRITKFSDYIESVGKDNVKMIPLATSLTLEEANILETYLISYYDTRGSLHGMNTYSGGRSSYIGTEEHHKRISERAIQRHIDNPELAQRQSEQIKRKDYPNIVNALGEPVIPKDKYDQMINDGEATLEMFTTVTGLAPEVYSKLICDTNPTGETYQGYRLADGNEGVVSENLYCVMNTETYEIFLSCNINGNAARLNVNSRQLQHIVSGKERRAGDWIPLPVDQVFMLVDEYFNGIRRLPTKNDTGLTKPVNVEGVYYSSPLEAGIASGYKDGQPINKRIKSDALKYSNFTRITWDEYYNRVGWPNPAQIHITYDFVR